MITEQEYLGWLDKTGVYRCLLVEANYLDQGVQGTVYVANFPYISGPNDTQPNQPYDEVIRGDLSLSKRLSEVFTGRSTVSRGSIDLINDGSLDPYVNYYWQGQAINVYLGDPTWSRDDFRLILAGVGSGVTSSRGQISLNFRDKSERLNVPFDRARLNDDTLSPLTFGEAFNISPVLSDAAASRYKVHDGAINAISDVRDNGLSVSFTADLANGEFTLNQAAVGQITADVQGAKPAGTYHAKAVDIARYLLTEYAGIDALDIQEADLTALDALAPYTCGLHITDEGNVLDAIDRLLLSIGAFWFFDRLGNFRVGRLAPPAGAPDLTLLEDDIFQDGITLKRRITPLTSVSLGYRKNWTVQDTVAGAVTEANRALYALDYSLATDSDATVVQAFPEARPSDEIETLLVSAADAAAEATRRLALVSVPRLVFEVSATPQPLQSELGDEIEVNFKQFDFAAGQCGRLVAITDGLSATQLEVWR